LYNHELSLLKSRVDGGNALIYLASQTNKSVGDLLSRRLFLLLGNGVKRIYRAYISLIRREVFGCFLHYIIIHINVLSIGHLHIIDCHVTLLFFRGVLLKRDVGELINLLHVAAVWLTDMMVIISDSWLRQCD